MGMNWDEAREILGTLVDGCDPRTGEMLPVGHVLLEEDVMEALLIAVDALRGKGPDAGIPLPEQDIRTALEILQAAGRRPTANSIAGFLLGDRAFKVPELLGHPFYGKLAGRFTKGAFKDQIEAWLAEHLPRAQSREFEPHAHFNPPTYNRLSERAIQQLKEKVAALPITKTTGLSETLMALRRSLPRANEPWPEEEVRLLRIALDFTNDVEFLSGCFGRSVLSIQAQGGKVLG